MAALHTFTLTDADGGAHAYEVALHDATSGQEIAWTLVAMGAEPVARLAGLVVKDASKLDAILGAFRAQVAGAEEGEGDVDFATLLGGIDLAGIGADVKSTILSLKMADLTARLLREARRDGLALSDRRHFDVAYAANYGELRAALWEVVKLNRFLSLLTT